jgi:hypothetical protein
MEQRSSWSPNNSLASEEISRILWNPKVEHSDLDLPPLFRTLSQNNPFDAFSTDAFKIHCNKNIHST